MIKQPSFTLPIKSKESWTRPENRSGWGEKPHLSIQARMVSHLLLHNRHQGAHAADMGCVATAPQGLSGLPAPISPSFHHHHALCLSLMDTCDQKIKKKINSVEQLKVLFFDLYNLTDHQQEANMVMSMQTTILASLLFQKLIVHFKLI